LQIVRKSFYDNFHTKLVAKPYIPKSLFHQFLF
jgi:hypothetical protein